MDIRLPTTTALGYVTVALVVLGLIVVIGGALLCRHRIRNRNPLSKRKEERSVPQSVQRVVCIYLYYLKNLFFDT